MTTAQLSPAVEVIVTQHAQDALVKEHIEGAGNLGRVLETPRPER